MDAVLNNTTSLVQSFQRKRLYLDYQREQHTIRLLKVGVWAYFLLLIFEGALRKWILPGLAAPLLVIRDPLALWLVLTAWNRSKVLGNVYVVSMSLISLLSFFMSLMVGHGNLIIALYGVRILLIHFPLIFVIGHVLTREDVIKIGKCTLWLSVLMVILIALQFYSPQSAWVNRGVGGDLAGAGFGGALGYFRPPGTFSFTNGNALFFSFAASYIFYFLIDSKNINKFLLILSLIALLISIPLSISRTLFFSITVTLFFLFIGASSKPQFLGRMLAGICAICIILIVVSQTKFFQTAIEVFSTRFQDANETEGGLKGVLGDRYLGGMVSAITNSADLPFWGYGIGLGTNVGSVVMTGNKTFLIAEGEWARIIGEMGLLLGLLVIIIRLTFSLDLTFHAFKKIAKGDLLPWMLLSVGLLNIPQTQWAQPTSLGFSTLIGGLVIASLKENR